MKLSNLTDEQRAYVGGLLFAAVQDERQEWRERVAHLEAMLRETREAIEDSDIFGDDPRVSQVLNKIRDATRDR